MGHFGLLGSKLILLPVRTRTSANYFSGYGILMIGRWKVGYAGFVATKTYPTGWAYDAQNCPCGGKDSKTVFPWPMVWFECTACGNLLPIKPVDPDPDGRMTVAIKRAMAIKE